METSPSPVRFQTQAVQCMLLSDFVHGDSDGPTWAPLPGRDVLLAGELQIGIPPVDFTAAVVRGPGAGSTREAETPFVRAPSLPSENCVFER